MTVSLAQLTDLHIARPRRYIDGTRRSTHETLQKVVDDLAEERFDALLCTGDITDAPDEQAYHDAFGLLAGLNCPVYCLPGNHDDPAMGARLAREYGFHWTTRVHLGQWQIVFLDSTQAGETHGRLSDAELGTLAGHLRNPLAPHTLITLHHHPVPVESLWMDRLMLQNPEALFNLIENHEHVRGILWGHVHQEFDTTRNGLRLIGSPSTCKQFTRQSEEYAVDDLPPAFRRLRLKPTGEIETEACYCR